MPVVKLDEAKKKSKLISNTNMLKALLIEPNKLPVEINIPESLKEIKNIMQCKCLGIKYIDDEDICVLYNPDAKKNNLLANRYVVDHGILYGKIIIIRETAGVFKSLNKDQIAKYKDIFGEESIKYTNKYLTDIIKLRGYMRR